MTEKPVPELEFVDGIADVMGRARKSLGISQSRLAKALGLKGIGEISAWENGRIRPPHKHALRMALACDLPLGAFFKGFSDDDYLRGVDFALSGVEDAIKELRDTLRLDEPREQPSERHAFIEDDQIAN